MSIGIGTSTTSGNVGIGTVKQPSTSSFSTSGTVGSSGSNGSSQQLKSNISSGSNGSNGSSGMPWYIKLLRKLDKDK